MVLPLLMVTVFGIGGPHSGSQARRLSGVAVRVTEIGPKRQRIKVVRTNDKGRAQFRLHTGAYEVGAVMTPSDSTQSVPCQTRIAKIRGPTQTLSLSCSIR